jgi:hypothetical protein
MNIWSACNGAEHMRSISAEPWRVVEAQHIISCRDLVDTIAEHDLLEEMLEASKPCINTDTDYLIFTPFRYPPLKYGSRFGHTYEPSLWYGSVVLETALAEVAHYQRQFHNDTQAELGYVETLLTAFTVYLKTSNGIDLTDMPFLAYKEVIRDKHDYQYSQVLGSAMRQDQVAAFYYFSARTNDDAKNIAAFVPDVFCKKNNRYVQNSQTWTCMANKEQVEFNRWDLFEKQRFSFMSS